MAVSTYREVEADLPGLAGPVPFSREWQERRRELHLAKYPECDQSTRDNLDMFVEWST